MDKWQQFLQLDNPLACLPLIMPNTIIKDRSSQFDLLQHPASRRRGARKATGLNSISVRTYVLHTCECVHTAFTASIYGLS